MKMKNRLWALLLTLAMVLTYMPALAFAEDAAPESAAESYEPVAAAELEGTEEAVESAPLVQESPKEESANEVAEEGATGEDVVNEAAEKGAEDEGGTEPVRQAAETKAAAGDPCVITINYNGGVLDGELLKSDSVEWTVGELFSLTTYGNIDNPDPHKVFDGWAFDEDGHDALDENNSFYAEGDTEVYVKWADAYSVTYDANSGMFSDGNQTSVTYKVKAGSFAEPPYYNPIKDGYYVAGWSLEKNGEIEESVTEYEFYPEEDVTLFAVWKVGFKVTFLEEENATEEQTHIFYVGEGNSAYDAIRGTCYSKYDENDRYYETVGWSTTPGGSEVDLQEYMITGDTTFYAIWARCIDVYYEPLQGYYPGWEVGYSMHTTKAEGTRLEDNSFSHVTVNGELKRVYNVSEPAIDDPDKAFDRWYMDEDLSEELPANLEITPKLAEEHNGTLFLYAGYTNAYTVTLDANGGIFNDTDKTKKTCKVPTDAALLLPTNDLECEEGENKSVNGWFLNPECTIDAGSVYQDGEWLYAPDENITLYAGWGEGDGPYTGDGFSYWDEETGEYVRINEGDTLDLGLRMSSEGEVYSDYISIYNPEADVYDIDYSTSNKNVAKCVIGEVDDLYIEGYEVGTSTITLEYEGDSVSFTVNCIPAKLALEESYILDEYDGNERIDIYSDYYEMITDITADPVDGKEIAVFAKDFDDNFTLYPLAAGTTTIKATDGFGYITTATLIITEDYVEQYRYKRWLDWVGVWATYYKQDYDRWIPGCFIEGDIDYIGYNKQVEEELKEEYSDLDNATIQKICDARRITEEDFDQIKVKATVNITGGEPDVRFLRFNDMGRIERWYPTASWGDAVHVTVTLGEGENAYVRDFDMVFSLDIEPTVTYSSYTYDGKYYKPVATVKYDGKVIPSDQYTVEYDSRYSDGYEDEETGEWIEGERLGNKNVGAYWVSVNSLPTSKYSFWDEGEYKINPKGATIGTPVAASKAITVKWTKQTAKMATSRITGYQIMLATNSTFTKGTKKVKVSGYSTASKKVTGLKGKTKYYIRIRTYKTVNGTTLYSPWSSTKYATTKA